MYKLLLVDDEDIEREGMAEMIPWERCGMELVGTAWNGIEGLEKIRMLSPDVVITDIKMPVMNGIELVRRGKEIFEDLIFVVLSGYGEYEFTSQAMELGVRYYLLKPCDEEKILEVLGKVREELTLRREKKAQNLQYHRTLRRLLPRAKEQLFSNMLLKHEQIGEDYNLFLEEVGEMPRAGILAFHAEKNFDYMEDFVLTNILEELFSKENVLLHTVIGDEALYLLKEASMEDIEPLVRKIRQEFGKFEVMEMQAVASRTSDLDSIPLLYQEIRNLLQMRIRKDAPLVLCSGLCQGEKDQYYFDYGKIKQAKRYEELLFEFYLGISKMRVEGIKETDMKTMLEQAFLVLWGEVPDLEGEALWRWVEDVVSLTAEKLHIALDGKDGARMEQVFLALYRNLSNPRLSIQYLAREELYMNEDYLGRLFQKYTGERYSAYIQHIRILLAKRLISHNPDIRVSELAERVGYPADGQYFAKAFKKDCGISPSEYRESVKNREKEN